MKYQCGEITDVGTTQPPGVTLSKGDPDNGIIYFALGTWTKEEYGVCEKEEGDKLVGTDEVPICVDTRDRNTFFSPDSPAVVAYGELVLDRSVTEWQEFTIKARLPGDGYRSHAYRPRLLGVAVWRLLYREPQQYPVGGRFRTGLR